MALGDNIRIPQLPQLTPQAINTELARIWTAINTIAGRSEGSQIRDNLEVLGNLSATGQVVGNTVSIDGLVVEKGNPSQAPLVPFPGQSLQFDQLGSVQDLTSPVSPFVCVLKDDFVGTGTTSGHIGELGWETLNATASVGGATQGHPGNLIISSTSAVGQFRLQTVHPFDLGYMAWIVAPTQTATVKYAFGWSASNPGTGVEVFQGAYFSYDSTVGPNWRTLSRDSVGITVLDSGVPLVAGNWFLLEAVHRISATEQIVDFYINRDAGARHRTNIPVGTARPIAVVQDSSGASSSMTLDRFICTGRVPLSVKVWT